jgi:hypothetical protein
MQKDRSGVWRPGAITIASALIIVSAVAGCAPSARPNTAAVAPESPRGPGGPAYATVDAVRAIPLAGAGGGSPQAQILTAMGIATAGGGGGESEVVVQTDDGQTLSVVGANTAGLAPGDRVLVVPGAVPRLARPGTGAPAS